MLREDLFYYIVRYNQSYDFYYSKSIINKYQFSKFRANSKNNALDDLILLRNDSPIFECKIQSVSNHPDYDFEDTIREGKLQFRMFVDRRKYTTDIHGVINTYDIEGQEIDINSKQWEDNHMKGRWLHHSDWHKFLFSAGCLVNRESSIQKENNILKSLNVKKYDVINGLLVEKDINIK